jgi:hypothetical protein
MNVITIDDDYDEGGCGNEKNAETRPTADNNGFDYDDADADVSSGYYTADVGDFKIFPFGSSY